MEEFLQNNFAIKNQPKQNFHFRYVTDLKSTHGALKGQLEEHPSIKLLLPQNGRYDDMKNLRDFYVLCTLHANNENKHLSAHHLMPKDLNEINYKFIFEKMQEIEGELVWELNNYVIVREKKTNYKTCLKKKEKKYQDLKLPLKFQKLSGNLDSDDESDLINAGICEVCLGFTIFERDFYNDRYTLYKNTIYSCNIYNGDSLRIHKICNNKGNINGGTEVTILIKTDNNITPNVLMKKIDPLTRNTVWSDMITIEKNDIFLNAAISFRTRAYNGPIYNNEDEIEVLINVVVGNSNYKSNEVKFYYIKEHEPKRKVNEGAIRQGKTVPTISRDSLSEPTTRSPLTESLITHYIATNDWDTMLDLALESKNNLMHVYKKFLKSEKKYLIVDYRNENYANLLHLACSMNKDWAIRPLIGLGCHIYQQDYEGRTPLHIALMARNDECILKIQQLIKDPSEYPKEFEQDIIRMFSVYNHNGYTVLHVACLGEYDDLLEIMFIFLQKHKLNILDYEVLGNGDTIAHLAFKNKKNISLIEKYIPNYREATNYGGTTVEDLEFEKLTI